MDKMIDKIESYSRRYEVDFGRGVYGKIASNFKKISGKIYDPLLVIGDAKDLIILERDFKNKKEIIKVHSQNSEAIQSRLETITGINLSQYRKYRKY